MLTEQCFSNLPWFQQTTRIAYEFNIELDRCEDMTKTEWKKYVRSHAYLVIAEKIKQMVKNTKYYKDMVDTENITIGVPMTYMKENRKISMAITRARTNTMDPKPRKPEWEKPYQCKLSLMKTQTSRHYTLECEMLSDVFSNKEDRIKSWDIVKTLRGSRKQLVDVGRKIDTIMKMLKSDEN